MCAWLFIESIPMHMYVWAGVDDVVYSEAHSSIFSPVRLICSVDDCTGKTWRQNVFESESESKSKGEKAKEKGRD